MKRISILAVIITGMLVITSCSNQGNKSSAAESQITVEKVIYTCPMHPEVVSDKLGTCPKCGMDLVKKEVKVENMKMKPGDTMKNMKD